MTLLGLELHRRAGQQVVADQHGVVLGALEPVLLIEIGIVAHRRDQRVVLARLGGRGDHCAKETDRRQRQNGLHPRRQIDDDCRSCDPPKSQLLSTVRRTDYGCLVAEGKRRRGVLWSGLTSVAASRVNSLRGGRRAMNSVRQSSRGDAGWALRIVPVILAGGQGTRLWPLSRSARPKQFLPLTGTSQPVSGDAEARLRPVALQRANHHHQCRVPLHRRRAGAGAGHRRSPASCSNRWPATPRRPSRPAAIFAAAAERRDAVIHVLASDAAIDADDGLLAVGRCRCRSRGGRQPRDLRHRADRPRDGLRLHRGRRGAGRRHARGRALRRKARSRQGRGDARRRAASTGTPACSCWASRTFLDECRALSPESFRGGRRAPSRRPRPISISSGSMRRASAKAPNISVDYAIFEKIASSSRWSRSASPGRTWAAGTRCGRSRPRTTARTRWSARRR